MTRRKPKPERLDALCAASDILVLRAEAPLPSGCRDAVVLRPGDFAAGGAAEIFATKTGWRVVWAQPLRGRRPWTASDSGG